MSFTMNIIDVGADSNMANLHMYRQHIGRQEQIIITDAAGVIDVAQSQFRIWYRQFYKAEDDTIRDEKQQYYVIKDVPGHANLTNRLTQLWRSSIDGSAPGIATAIETVLAALPFTVPQGYILNT